MALAAPSGLAVTRNNDVYTFTWKRPADYTWQHFYYSPLWNGKPLKNIWVAVGARAASISVTIDRDLYFPKTDMKVSGFRFYVRGFKGGGVSGWSYKDYLFAPPRKPFLTMEKSTENENSTTFKWTEDWETRGPIDKATTPICFTDYQWWTSLLPNSDMNPEEVTDWQETGTTPKLQDVGEKVINETLVYENAYSYTRYFKLQARGFTEAKGYPGGGVPSYAKRIFAIPNEARNVKATATRLENGAGYRVRVQWTADESKSRPIDSVSLEYALATPNSSHTDVNGVRKVSLSVPNISSWTSAVTLGNSTTKNGNTSGATFVINGEIDADKCIFVRVVTKYETKTAPSEIVMVEGGYGALSAPTRLSATISTTTASVTVTNASAVTESIVGIYYRSDINPQEKLVGIWEAGRNAALSVTLPDEGATQVSLGARTFVASYSPIVEGANDYALSDIVMQSPSIIWDSRPVPAPPSNITLTSPKTGVVRITWDWTWTDANGVEISWADHEDAWESTEGPTTYTIPDRRASAWNVAGLSVGVWYFRVRLFKNNEDSESFGTYSAIHSIKLASTPATPVLTISPTIVPPNGSFSCYWAFSATEGDEQVQADICEASLDENGTVTYGSVIAIARNEQFVTLNTANLGWNAGSTHYLAVKVITASGEQSENWSIPKPIQILNPITAEITSTSLRNITVLGRTQLSLTDMPLTISGTGAGEGGSMTYILERAASYHITRPDENDINGFEGETIAIIQKAADNSGGGSATFDVSIDIDDLIGPLDDGAAYNLIVTAKDSYGQASEPVYKPFEVHWAHQAVIPSANIEVDNENLVTYITPIQPSSGYADGDVCDIYRLSSDKPELIIANAEFGTRYVDLYPALGSSGGHRVVYKTTNGDYITENNEFAWVDYTHENGDILNRFATIIDFGDDRAILPYDLSLSNKWSKDFTQTKYLGGSIEGDWNPGVERALSVKTRVAVKEDFDLIETMRRLALYSGVCHVRTPDGSSFDANIDVNEDREEKKINMVATFSLDITRVDASGFGGIEYSRWINGD